MSEAHEFIGLDIGDKWVGVARGSAKAKLAEPLSTWSADEALAKLVEHASQSRLAGVVVGLPRGLSGQETEQTKLVRVWAIGATELLPLKFYFQDEALTSQEAAKRTGKADEHAEAAAIILQDFLDTPHDEHQEVKSA